MKTIIKLLLLALVLHAAFQVGVSTWRYFAFRDAVHSQLIRGSAKNVDELQKNILAIAERNDVALEQGDVQVGLEGDETTITILYEEQVPLLPFSLYTYPWTFDASTRGRPVKPIPVNEIR